MEPRLFAGKYRVERELGLEHAGRTYLAVAPDGNRVVVKVVHPVDAIAAAALERDVATVSGIRDEALPTVHEWGHDGSDFFVVRDYVPGADLELELGQQGKFAPLTAARYVAQAAGALGLIHERGLVHGNVKTANLIRTPEDEIKLVGNSLGLASPALQPGAPASAARYLAPEQIEGGTLSPATDVYAMGVVLYELIAGHVPFDGHSADAVGNLQVHDVPNPIRGAEPEMPAGLEAVVMKALEKSQEQRYANGNELRAALDQVISPTPAVIAAMPHKRPVWPWVLAAILIVAAGLGLAWALGAFGPQMATVPSVVGMTQSDATAALAAAGLTAGTVSFEGRSVAGVADGSVASQSPAAGAKVTPDSSVALVLAGIEAVAVPDVVGLTQTQATASLQTAGLGVGTITAVSTTTVSAGTVVAQTPLAGASLGKGGSVDLLVAQSSAAVPDVTGETKADAQRVLEAAGFVVAVGSQSNASVPAGNVIEQDPVAGFTAQIGSKVTIVVSTGPSSVVVPNVVGQSQANAVNALTAAGFKTQIVFQTGGGTVGDVITQAPAAGAKAASGSNVTITVVQ